MRETNEQENIMTRNLRDFFIIFSLLIVFITCMAGPAPAQDLSASDITNPMRGLSPEQVGEIKNEIAGTGGVLPPETIRLLKETPEFKDLSAEDIARGKELLEKQQAERKEAAPSGESNEARRPDKRDKESVSLFDRYRTVGQYQNISTALRPFGYEFFSEVSAKSLVPRKDIPASSDYIVGPGDEIKILMWGRVNAQHNLVVDRDGNITIPQIGPLQVAGMRFDEMKRYLSDQTDQIIGAKTNVTMGALKSIQVFVLGEVRKPGSYALDSFSTIATAVLAAGGPTEIGSLRNIELKRNHDEPVVMDFYDFLLKGDKSRDVVLKAGDVVFVPTAGPLAGVAGNVKRPAIYELKDKRDLMTLFEMAGGVIPSAYTQQIQVERIQKNERRIVIDIDDRDLIRSKDFEIRDGDLVKVFPIVDKDMNVIFLSGNVKRPGKYEYKPGMKIMDLIKGPSDLLGETYFEYALIKRLRPPGLETELIPFHPGRLLFDKSDADNIALQPQDAIYIFSKWTFKDRPAVTVEGEVRKKGAFALPENYRIKDAILEAGGLTKDAGTDKGEIFRKSDTGDVSQIYFSVGKAMAGDPEENMLLKDGDSIRIHSIWEERQKQTVSVDGDVKNPGQYPLAGDMRVSDLIFTAGNVLESAYLDEAEISSFIVDDGKTVRTDYRKINLGAALQDDPAHNLVLRPYDRVFVKRIPDWKEERFVDIAGEVMFPGRYILKKAETLSSVLERAGGYTDRAHLRGAVFTRRSVQKLQQENLKAMLIRLERELLAEGSMQISSALSKEEIEAKKSELEQKQKFLASLGKLEATGRMSIRLSHLRLLKNSQYDIELEDGDALRIPVKNNVVNVIGAVMSPGTFVFADNLDYKNYVDLSGGYSKYADTDNVYILKTDGTAMKLPDGLFTWSNSRDRWELTSFGQEIKDVEPGDSIVVPEKLDRIAWLREIKDLTQILYQIAVTAGVAIIVF